MEGKARHEPGEESARFASGNGPGRGVGVRPRATFREEAEGSPGPCGALCPRSPPRTARGLPRQEPHPDHRGDLSPRGQRRPRSRLLRAESRVDLGLKAGSVVPGSPVAAKALSSAACAERTFRETRSPACPQPVPGLSPGHLFGLCDGDAGPPRRFQWPPPQLPRAARGSELCTAQSWELGQRWQGTLPAQWPRGSPLHAACQVPSVCTCRSPPEAPLPLALSPRF